MANDEGNEIQISSHTAKYRRARLLFVPIVGSFTLFFGLFDGLKGAIIGFLYGIVGGLFLIHESLPVKRKTTLFQHDFKEGKGPEERIKK